jgi:hypothetical protein
MSAIVNGEIAENANGRNAIVNGEIANGEGEMENANGALGAGKRA